MESTVTLKACRCCFFLVGLVGHQIDEHVLIRKKRFHQRVHNRRGAFHSLVGAPRKHGAASPPPVIPFDRSVSRFSRRAACAACCFRWFPASDRKALWKLGVLSSLSFFPLWQGGRCRSTQIFHPDSYGQSVASVQHAQHVGQAAAAQLVDLCLARNFESLAQLLKRASCGLLPHARKAL